MSFAALRDVFVGKLGADNAVRSLLFLESPSNVKQYLIGIHKVTFPSGDSSKTERWHAYPHVKGISNVTPIRDGDLLNTTFMNKQANKLSFDISRFIEFLTGYTKVDDDIKPVMLHYSMIYLLDFFSRTWLKYPAGSGRHGITLIQQTEKNTQDSSEQFRVRLGKQGILPRAVDAFYLVNQSSLFSLDNDSGIFPRLARIDFDVEKVKKVKYSEQPELNLADLIALYEKLKMPDLGDSKSNPILVGYIILFIMSSISRYRSEEWFKIRENRNLKNKLDLIQYDFLYEWAIEILLQTALKRGLF